MVTAGMTPRDAVRQLEARLTAAGCPDADYDAAELFRLVTGRDVRLADAPLAEAQAARLESLCLRREAREPLQYLCGRWSFLDFELIVGPGVLCPRADTEVVAEAAAQTLAGVKAPRVLDLCAGTGCLGLGVKRFCPDAQVTCVEKSPEAFRYLEQNVRTALPGAAPAVQAVQGDLFTYWQSLPEGQLDLIVSNPPYLMTALCSTGPLRSTTGRPCAPAGHWCWRSVGSSGRPSWSCWPGMAGQTSNAAGITAATTAASLPTGQNN